MTLELKTEPVNFAVLFTVFKTHLRIEHNSEDTYIKLVLQSAVKTLEDWVGRSFVNQVWKLTLEGKEFPPNKTFIKFSRPPLVSLDSFKWWDTDDTEQTITVATVLSVSTGELSKAFLKNGQSWPSGVRWNHSAELEYTSGYGTEDKVPQPLQNAVMMLGAHYYENREFTAMGSLPTKIQLGIEELTAPYNKNIGF